MRTWPVALLLLLAACGGPENDPGPVITPAEDWDGFPTALVSGRLALHDGCLLLDGHVVFWPKGTGWDSDSRELVTATGGRVALGTTFRGGGGSYDVDTDFADLLASDEAAERIAGCVADTGSTDVVLAVP